MEIYKRKVLEALANSYNENTRLGAFWRACDHDTWEKYAVGATAVLDVIDKLFARGSFYFRFITETRNNVTFEWRKMEVL